MPCARLPPRVPSSSGRRLAGLESGFNGECERLGSERFFNETRGASRHCALARDWIAVRTDEKARNVEPLSNLDGSGHTVAIVGQSYIHQDQVGASWARCAAGAEHQLARAKPVTGIAHG